MLGDTIQAVASPAGRAERAVLRLSGPEALAAANTLFEPSLARRRAAVAGTVRVLGQRAPALALVMVAPASYTGEDVVELHLPGSPLLLQAVARALADRARPAQPGEFTRRAYENGRLDLAAAEGVLRLVHAATESDRKAAWSLLQGGLDRAIAATRAAVQDALALLEAGLDFDEEETGAVGLEARQVAVAAAAQATENLQAQWPGIPEAEAVLLLGAANAGKSALANALAGRPVALVSAVAGTTRDLLRVELAPGVVLWDGPGDLVAGEAADRQALAQRDRLAARAAAALLVVDSTAPWVPSTDLPVLALVHTKCDLAAPPRRDPARPHTVPCFAVSAKTGAGIEALRRHLLRHAGGGAAGQSDAIGAGIAAAVVACRSAADALAGQAPDELVAADLALALRELDRVHGSSSPEDLLDRIFGRFCLGK